MNSERSQFRDWRRQVAIGLGRPLSKTEAREVNAMVREYNLARAAKGNMMFGMYPSNLVEKFQVADATRAWVAASFTRIWNEQVITKEGGTS